MGMKLYFIKRIDMEKAAILAAFSVQYDLFMYDSVYRIGQFLLQPSQK